MAATTEAAETAEAEVAEAVKAAEWAAIVAAEAVINAAGAAVSKRKEARIESSDKTSCPDRYFCLKPHKASECPNRSPPLQRRRTLPTLNMAVFGVVSAPTLGVVCSSPQALARLCPHAALRASGMKMSAGWQTAVLPII